MGWTAEEEQKLKKAVYENKLTYEEITKKYFPKRSQKAVSSKAQRMGITGNKKNTRSWSEKEKNKLIELAKKGKSDKQISKILNRTERAITNKRRIIAPDFLINKWTDKEIKRLLIMYKNGATYEQISKELNRSKSSVTHKALRLGLPEIFDKERGED